MFHSPDAWLFQPSGNLDSPEGGLDALLQVARCPDHIGWRKNARKIVLFATDGGFHLAGDGRLAGLIKPPPKTCQLTYEPDRFNKSLVYLGWHNSVETDYPSVGEVLLHNLEEFHFWAVRPCFCLCFELPFYLGSLTLKFGEAVCVR